MPDDLKPYAKTFDDELDWKLLDQLHGVVSQISSFCFETKKFCVTTEFVVLAFLVKFTADKLDHSLFVAGLVIPVCFWFLDAVGYYYQVKVRGAMESIRTRLTTRNSTQLIAAAADRVISRERVDRPALRRASDAFVNHSMWIYAVLVFIDLLLWALFVAGTIS